MICNVVDIANSKIKKLDIDDPDWVSWFNRNYTSIVAMPGELEMLLKEAGSNQLCVIVAIER
jgi:hypothetical protein